MGCMMNEQIINHLIYEDALVVVAPSASALLYLQFAHDHDHDMIYNIKRSYVCPKNQI
jgi:hypothetical protein